MRIKMLVSVAGDTFSVAPGQETDVFSAEAAQRYIDSGQAVAVDTPKPAKVTPEKRKK
jgi:hypothetical protein